MASKLALVAMALIAAGCTGGDENSPEMGAVPPQPRADMNSKLPESVQRQLSQAKPGADAQAMRQTAPPKR